MQRVELWWVVAALAVLGTCAPDPERGGMPQPAPGQGTPPTQPAPTPVPGEPDQQVGGPRDGGVDVRPPVDGGAVDGGATEPGPGDPPTPGEPGWRVLYREDFSSDLPQATWREDEVPDDGPFSDEGVYFTGRGIFAPDGRRVTVPFGEEGWLTLESYTRSAQRSVSAHAQVVVDPAQPQNRALRIASPDHTDGTVVRPSAPLTGDWRVTVRVGFAQFGDGRSGSLNGYDGGEMATPWLNEPAVSQNGFYWLAVLDAPPRPHNNVWIHHHRKVVIDSDNHHPPWMEIWNGQRFISSGERPVMMFAIDAKGTGWQTSGKPFLSYSAGAWQPSGAIRAVDRYLPGEWYTASIERKDGVFTLEVSGRFEFGGQTTYRASIDAAQHCVWHFNRPGETAPSRCIDTSHWPALSAAFPHWPQGQGWPDYFMFGDPHTNFYEGEVLYDDVTLEVWE